MYSIILRFQDQLGSECNYKKNIGRVVGRIEECQVTNS